MTNLHRKHKPESGERVYKEARRNVFQANCTFWKLRDLYQLEHHFGLQVATKTSHFLFINNISHTMALKLACLADCWPDKADEQ